MVSTQLRASRRISTGVLVALVCVYLFWGGTYLGMRYAIATIPPFLMAGLRFSVAGWVLYAAMRFKGASRPTWLHWRNAGLVGALLLVGGNGVVAMAEQVLPSSIASLLIGTVPLWITLIQYGVDRRKPTLGGVIGVVMGLCGIAVLVWNPSGEAAHAIPFGGVLAVLGAALSWSAGSYYSRKAQLPSTPLLSTGMQMIVGGALLLVVAVLHGDFAGFTLAQVSPTSWLALGYLIIFGSLLGYTAYIWLFRNAEPMIASTYAYVNPIVAIFLGWLIAGEPIGLNTLVAATIIIASVVVITLFRDASPAAGKGHKT